MVLFSVGFDRLPDLVVVSLVNDRFAADKVLSLQVQGRGKSGFPPGGLFLQLPEFARSGLALFELLLHLLQRRLLFLHGRLRPLHVSLKLGHFHFEAGVVLEDLPNIQQRDPLRLHGRRSKSSALAVELKTSAASATPARPIQIRDSLIVNAFALLNLRIRPLSQTVASLYYSTHPGAAVKAPQRNSCRSYTARGQD